jgi:hypothetical protein
MVLAAAVAMIGVGCSSSTRVELDSADAPAVEPADGGAGQSDAGVIPAGAIDLDDPTSSTTTSSSTKTVPSDDQTVVTTTVTVGGSPDKAAAMIAEMCRIELTALRTAVDDYETDYDEMPTSEGDLLAFGYIRQRSDLYDVFVDGSVVVQGDTCR